MKLLRRRSAAELIVRARQRLRVVQERMGWAPLPRAEADPSLIPRLPFPHPGAQEIETVYNQRPGERATLLEHAEGALAGRFHLLGFRELGFGMPVDWHREPTRDRQAPLSHWSRVPYLDPEVVGDHKIIWELNRHQWLVTMAQAWRLTGEVRYAGRIGETLIEWMAANPPRRGINWASSLELAFRAIAWTWTLHLSGEALTLSIRERREVMATLELHGIQIERFLSTWFSPNTHLTGEALGLLYLGTAWPHFRRARRWRALGWRILLQQLPIHIRDDGTYFEQSTWYLGYTADFYLHAILLARANGLEVPGWAAERVSRAVGVVAAIRRPDGTLPLIGDDDGGRLLPLDPHRTRFDDTLALGAAVLKRPVFCYGPEIPAGAIWMVGSEVWHRMDGAALPARPATSEALRDGGWYLLRGPEGALLVDAGVHGALAGGHSHADALCVDLTIGARPVVVDPGTGAYVGPLRDKLRSSVAHSTLSLADGTGSATPTGLFRWGSRWPVTRVHHWSTGPGWAMFEGEHDGFGAVQPGLRHRRTVLFREGWGWLVIDRLVGGEAEARIRFQCDAGIALHLYGPVATAHEGENPVVRFVTDDTGRNTVETGLVSPCYGVTREAPALVRHIDSADAQRGVATLLTTDPEVTLTRRASGWRWSSPAAVANITLGEDGLISFVAPDLTVTVDPEGS